MRLLNAADGQVDSSLLEFAVDRALELNPADHLRQRRLGEALYRYGDDVRALQALLSAVALNDIGQFWPHYYLGLVYFRNQQFNMAESAFLKTLELGPNFGRAYQWMARTLIRLERSEEALGYYQEAVRLLPDDQKLASEYQLFLDVLP
jgi:tetratricopeptide (TPR) repeat protein